jgi:hypothetical protein
MSISCDHFIYILNATLNSYKKLFKTTYFRLPIIITISNDINHKVKTKIL